MKIFQQGSVHVTLNGPLYRIYWRDEAQQEFINWSSVHNVLWGKYGFRFDKQYPRWLDASDLFPSMKLYSDWRYGWKAWTMRSGLVRFRVVLMSPGAFDFRVWDGTRYNSSCLNTDDITKVVKEYFTVTEGPYD